MVAHDFRRPLTAIRGFAELVLESPDLGAETRSEFMNTIIRETDARQPGRGHLAHQPHRDRRVELEFAQVELGR
jgi:signal transduction histidine kinase